MGNISYRQRPFVSDFATNTDVSLYYNQSAILAELKTLQNRISVKVIFTIRSETVLE